MGDVNIDLTNQNNKTHVPRYAKKLLNILDSCNLIQIITRISSTRKTLIDLAYGNNNKEIIHTAVPIYGISDHYPICITRKYSKKEEKGRQTIVLKETK